MSIQKEDLLSLADELRSGASEPHWRSAVSRAYYAAYHGCNDWHTTLPMPGSNAGPGGGTHQQLLNKLASPDATVDAARKTKSKILAAKLGVLRKDRHTADYALGEVVDEVHAQRACLLAAEILAKLV